MDIQAYSENTKLQEWAEMLSKCKASGLTVVQWCAEQGIGVKTYYYRRKQVERALEQIEPGNIEKPVRFAELTKPDTTISADSAAMIECGDIRIHIANRADEKFLKALIRALRNVC